jgi:hypothetical protein
LELCAAHLLGAETALVALGDRGKTRAVDADLQVDGAARREHRDDRRDSERHARRASTRGRRLRKEAQFVLGLAHAKVELVLTPRFGEDALGFRAANAFEARFFLQQALCFRGCSRRHLGRTALGFQAGVTFRLGLCRQCRLTLLLGRERFLGDAVALRRHQRVERKKQ